jgi:hypothetical protein
MDAITLATAVVNLLIPHLPRITEAVSKGLMDEALEKLKSIFTAVKEKFAGNVYAEETLKRVEDQPQSQSRQAALVGVLEEQIQGDPVFADNLRKLIGKAKTSESEIINQKVTVSGNAKTGDITTLGKVEGNVDMRKKKK